MISLFFKKYLINIFLFFYLLFYISGPAPINIYVTLISLFCLIHIIKNFDSLKNEFNDKSSILLIIFFFYILIVSIIKKNFNFEFLSFLRFFFIYLSLNIFANSRYEKLKIKEIFIFFIIIITFDSFYQYHFGKNIFGFEIFDNYRLTSFFKDEPIVGSFLLKITLPLIGIYLTKSNKNIYFLMIIILSTFIIFLSGERMPLMQLIFGIFLLTIFLENKKKVISIFSIIFLIIFIGLSLNQKLLDRYSSTFSTLYFAIQNFDSNEVSNKNPSVNIYIKNFKSGIKIWSQNKYFGGGYRYYNKNCSLIIQKVENLKCSTHPHNIYLEVLSDYGLIGLIIFISFIISNIIKIINNYKNSYILSFGILFSVIVFPLTTSQSIFSSYYGSIFFLFIFLINYFLKNHNKN